MTPPRERPRIAVINDNIHFKTAIQRVLERDGYDVHRLRGGWAWTGWHASCLRSHGADIARFSISSVELGRK